MGLLTFWEPHALLYTVTASRRCHGHCIQTLLEQRRQRPDANILQTLHLPDVMRLGTLKCSFVRYNAKHLRVLNGAAVAAVYCIPIEVEFTLMRDTTRSMGKHNLGVVCYECGVQLGTNV